MRKRRIKVMKESGELEGFDSGKLLESLERSGIMPETAEDVLRKISPLLRPRIPTREIYKLVRGKLGTLERGRMRYALKRAIFDLGPTGYPFEKYVARILVANGYTVKVGVIVQGRCVRHEVDVVARRGKERFMVECKFHINPGIYSNVKTALYIHSRFQDIKRAERKRGRKSDFSRGMLVTNTRFSTDATDYARCVGLKAIGWKYPRAESLERMIDKSKVYPVTVLPGLGRRAVRALLGGDIILASDLAGLRAEEIAEITGLKPEAAKKLRACAVDLCQ